MPNGIYKRDEFEAATRVMESDLLQILTDESSDSEANDETDASTGTSPEIEIVVAEPMVLPSTETIAPVPPANAASGPQRGGSRVFLVAGMVAAIVLAFDASLFVFHQRRIVLPVAEPAVSDPMPRYMVLPLGSPPARVEEAGAEAPAPTSAPPTTTVVAAAAPAPTPTMGHARRHSHHRHASH